MSNQRAALEPARQALLGFLSPLALSPKAVYGIELVLEEVLMNAVSYAYPEGGEHAIELTVVVRPDHVALHFEDDGVAFDPLQAPLPVQPPTIDDASPGGRGLLLVRSFAKAATYQRSGGRNRLTIDIARD
jgi:serine/threonine-protein kinase RsbW/sigma-B regulation protein RsbU (phosphoserine phosphatase)